MKLLPVYILLSCLLVTSCTDRQIVTETQIVKIKPPVVTPCKRYSIQECKPITNGELFECGLEITKQLNLCADQIDSLREWQGQQQTE